MYVKIQICEFQCLDNRHPCQFCLKSVSGDFTGNKMKNIA